MLQQQLDRVALMLEQSPNFTRLEAFVWRRLARHVDAPHFERTGQIIAPMVDAETLAGRDEPSDQEITPSDVRLALETLVEKGHLVISHRAKHQDHYRLVLPQSMVNELTNG